MQNTYTYETEDGANGVDQFLPYRYSALIALAQAAKDGDIKIEAKLNWYRVELLGGDEFGEASDFDTALRYALGAHFSNGE